MLIGNSKKECLLYNNIKKRFEPFYLSAYYGKKLDVTELRNFYSEIKNDLREMNFEKYNVYIK